MEQLTFLEPGKLEWRDVPEPRLSSDAEAVASHGGKLVITR